MNVILINQTKGYRRKFRVKQGLFQYVSTLTSRGNLVLSMTLTTAGWEITVK